MKSLDWMGQAECRNHDPELFFPQSTGVPGQREAERAAAICATCPVQVECGEYRKFVGATAGVWGGQAVRVKNAAASSGGPRNVAAHGTNAGYNRHIANKQKPCLICAAAHSAKHSPGGRSKTRRWSA